ncbi:hypothetical protein BGZ83_009840 [Gryganskiella cystojenkinii]|nr:hypothetical protein BGZ83_009840 [Gryganskiella cystojenkinii]
MSQTPPQSPARVEDEDESDDDTVFLDYINQLQSESEDEQVDDELIQAYLDHEQYEHENEDDFEEEESETVRDHLDQNMPTWLQNLQALPSPPNTPKRNRVKNITFKGHEEPLKAIVYGTKTVTEETAVTDPNEQELLVVRAEEETACPFSGATANTNEGFRDFLLQYGLLYRSGFLSLRFRIIHDVFSNFEKDIETLPLGERSRSFQTGWIYYLIFEPTSYQHYELSQELIENNSVVIKNGVTSCKEARFNRHREDCGIDKAPLYIFPSKTDDTNDEGVPFAWLLESIMHGYARGQQYSFQCKCRTLHTEMFLYRRLGEESKEKAMEAVVVYLTPVINDWIKALRILRPLQIHLMNRVHKIDQS